MRVPVQLRPDAVCRIVGAPTFSIVVEGTVHRTNATPLSTELVEVLGSHRGPCVIDLTEVVLADCTGVRRLSDAIATLMRSGRQVLVRTADPVARLSFDVARVA